MKLILFLSLLFLMLITLIAIFGAIQFWPNRSRRSIQNQVAELNSVTSIVSLTTFKQIGQVKTKWFNLIDRIGVVMLPKRYDDFKARMGRFLDFNSIHVLNAVRGDTLKKDELIKKGFITAKAAQSTPNNVIGCALSHCILLQSFLDDPTKPNLCLSFEDDIETISEKDIKYATAQMKELATIPSFDLFFFSYTGEPKNITNQSDVAKFTQDGLKHIWKLNDPSCVTAVIFSRAGAKKLLDSAVPIDDHIDLIIRKMVQGGKLDAWGAIRRVFNQDKSHFKSTLGGKHTRDYPLLNHFIPDSLEPPI